MYWNGTTDTTYYPHHHHSISTVPQHWWRGWMVFVIDGILKRESNREGIVGCIGYMVVCLRVWCTYWSLLYRQHYYYYYESFLREIDPIDGLDLAFLVSNGSLLNDPKDYYQWYDGWRDCCRKFCGTLSPAINEPITKTTKRSHDVNIISVHKYWHILNACITLLLLNNTSNKWLLFL